jgi:hypothetical protein
MDNSFDNNFRYFLLNFLTLRYLPSFLPCLIILTLIFNKQL